MRAPLSFVERPVTHYGRRLFDLSTPCDSYSPGLNVDKAWADVLRESPAIRDFQRGAVAVSHPFHLVPWATRRHYTAQDRCRVCKRAQACLKHQCRRCYHRTYMRAYYQTHRHQH